MHQAKYTKVEAVEQPSNQSPELIELAATLHSGIKDKKKFTNHSKNLFN